MPQQPAIDMSDLTTTPPANAQVDMSDLTTTPPSATPDMSDLTTTPPGSSTSDSTPPAPDRGLMSNIVGGILKGVSETGQGALNLAARGVEKLTGQPSGSLQATRGPETEKPSIARGGGELAETAGEFVLGGEVLDALKGLEFLNGAAKAAKLTELATKYPMVGHMLSLSKEYPVIAKILGETAKSAAIGGVQGGVKGAAEGQAAKGAEEGAAGGATGAFVGETAGALAQQVGKVFGIGTTGLEDVTRGAKPAKRNYRFAQDFQRAAPYMDADNSVNPAQSVEDWADHTDAARKKLWADKIQPIIDKHASVPLSGVAIRDEISNAIPAAMKKFKPAEAAEVERLANQFMPGQVFATSVGDVEDALEHFNAELSSTGYWSKLPQERAALLRTNGEALGYKAAADALRNELYNRLEILEPTQVKSIEELKKDYGALRNVGSEIRGQVNVAGREAPLSLKQTVGAVTGLAHGTPLGAAAAAIPFVDRWVNSPENLIARGVQKAVRPGEEGFVSRGAQAVGRAAKEVAPAAGAMAGENRAEQRVYFTASNGSSHSVPVSQIEAARKIDPHLVITDIQ